MALVPPRPSSHKYTRVRASPFSPAAHMPPCSTASTDFTSTDVSRHRRHSRHIYTCTCGPILLLYIGRRARSRCCMATTCSRCPHRTRPPRRAPAGVQRALRPHFMTTTSWLKNNRNAGLFALTRKGGYSRIPGGYPEYPDQLRGGCLDRGHDYNVMFMPAPRLTRRRLTHALRRATRTPPTPAAPALTRQFLQQAVRLGRTSATHPSAPTGPNSATRTSASV